jgi:hypothetical protein
VTSQAWLPIFRAIAAEVRAAVPPLAGTPAGRQVVGLGAGGDQTIYLDQLAIPADLGGAWRARL